MAKNLFLILKESILISDVIGEYIALSKRGKNFFGLCPFHEDTSPSLVANNDKKIFKCFVCGTTGDLITFVMNKEKISFPMAVITISKKYGIKSEAISILESRNRITKGEKEFYEINFQAAEIYHNFLFEKENKEARNYLYVRGLSDDDIRKYQIGFAPKGFDTLINLMTNQTNIFGAGRDKALVWETTKLLKSKLIILNDKGDYQDFFYNRIIFPIRDEFKRVVAFSGRAISNKITPKYLNSMVSNFFKKDSILYNMENVWNSSSTRLFITEGFMDVILASKNGADNIVGTMGSELSENHIFKIRKNNFKSIIVLMDNDKAGKKSNLIIGKKLLKSSCNVMVVKSYDKKSKDLADLATSLNNPDQFNAIVNDYVTYLEYLINAWFENTLPIDVEIERVDKITNLISKYGNVALKQYYATLISKKTSLEKEGIIELINSFDQKFKNHTTEKTCNEEGIYKNYNVDTFSNDEKNSRETKRTSKVLNAEKKVIEIMMMNPEVAQVFIENLNDTISLSKGSEYLFLLGIIRKLSSKTDKFYSLIDISNEIDNNQLASTILTKIQSEATRINASLIRKQGLELIKSLIREKQKLANLKFGEEINISTENEEKKIVIKFEQAKVNNSYNNIVAKIEKMMTSS